MTTAIVNRMDGEVLHVELELGGQLWLRNESGQVEKVKVEHLPLERWAFEGAGANVDDLPVRITHKARQFAQEAMQ